MALNPQNWNEDHKNNHSIIFQSILTPKFGLNYPHMQYFLLVLPWNFNSSIFDSSMTQMNALKKCWNYKSWLHRLGFWRCTGGGGGGYVLNLINSKHRDYKSVHKELSHKVWTEVLKVQNLIALITNKISTIRFFQFQ